MGKVSLQIKATLENVDEIAPNHPDYNYLLKMKCTNCGEVSDKWHDVSEARTYPTKMGKKDTHFLAKCKLCGRESSVDIVQGSNGSYTLECQGNFKSIVTFECRGFEPIEFSPGPGWKVKVRETGNVFDADLSEKEWVEYDEELGESFGIYEFASQFVKVK
ncbi:UPF0587 protein CG4646 [Agrilus planipennis]|uniref:UPF0587 protein CG4646 n=1 Tax=Agrilus planipennis TaxID=224129 RepID=A0A1W4W6E4_AGRPL|nr:UPF0587 protein CG4646 [Agrilus planipennis]XP_018319687.1 UPF0587 protein CG4646 [Agrilus planipennis]